MAYAACILVPFLEDSISSADLAEIGGLVAARDPSILWKPVRLGSGASEIRPPRLPTMILQFHDLVPAPWPDFKGPRVESRRVHKATQMRMMQAAGIPVPRWARLERGTQVDPAEFGEFLIIKPTEREASLGHGVTLIRTADFERYRNEHAPTYEGYRRSPPLVQEFIYTGERPLHYRVMSFMGRIVLCFSCENPRMTPLAAPVTSLSVTEKVISNITDNKRLLQKDPELLDLGARAAAVFTDNSVVGVDIVRSARNGKAYVLEANMGNAWVFSNAVTRTLQAYLGRNNMKKQFGAPGIIADAIIERARKELPL
mgnify:FL=1